MLIKPAAPKKVAGFSHLLAIKTKTPRRSRQRGFSDYGTKKQQMAHGSSPTLPHKPSFVKSINPETGKPWRRGERHPVTGKRFMSFNRARAKSEYWGSEEAYQRSRYRGTNAYFKEFNPDLVGGGKQNPANKWRRGDVHPESGLVFWHYRRRVATTERWLTPEEFAIRHPAAKKRVTDYAARNPDATKIRARCYYIGNKKKHREYSKRWKRENAHKVNEGQKRRYRTDPLYQLKKRLRTRTRNAFLTYPFKKGSKTFEMVGCTQDELFKHIEAQFTDGMSWDRLGDIEIDHIIPLASAKTEEELIALCHYTNLQPLWAEHNRLKGTLMPEAFALLDLPPPPPPPPSDGLPVDFQPPTE